MYGCGPIKPAARGGVVDADAENKKAWQRWRFGRAMFRLGPRSSMCVEITRKEDE
jgi:hypothetical protein